MPRNPARRVHDRPRLQATATPLYSLHNLRHRRASLRTDAHVVIDRREVDSPPAREAERPVQTPVLLAAVR